MNCRWLLSACFNKNCEVVSTFYRCRWTFLLHLCIYLCLQAHNDNKETKKLYLFQSLLLIWGTMHKQICTWILKIYAFCPLSYNHFVILKNGFLDLKCCSFIIKAFSIPPELDQVKLSWKWDFSISCNNSGELNLGMISVNRVRAQENLVLRHE